MARPRTPVGTFGDIWVEPVAGGRYRAGTRYRDEDGRLRRVTATGDTARAAERLLKERIASRSYQAGGGELTPDSSFGQLADLWLADLDLEGRLSASTRDLYERNLRQLVRPAFESFALREITVSKVDRFLKAQAQRSYSYAKQSKVVLSLVFGLAVRYEAMPRNPARETARLRKPPSQAKALSVEDVQAIRRAVADWRQGPGLSGPRPDGQLAAIIEVMLGTSARIGEVLAIRVCDVDVTTTPATVRLCGTIISRNGKPTFRQGHPKTSKSRRTVSVPSFTAQVIRARLVELACEDREHLLFCSRNGTPLTTNNVRRLLRTILADAGIPDVTPHAFRRTVATVIDRAGGADLAAEMLGHTSSDITRLHYIEPNDRVNPVTAQILEQLAPAELDREA